MDGDVVDLDATFKQEFFDVSIRESVAEVPTHSQRDHLRRKPVAGERRTIDRWELLPVIAHVDTVAERQADLSTQQCLPN